MTAPHADQLIDGYLARVRAAAADLPGGAREELIADMRVHISEARSRESNETDATILNILDRLGEPDIVVDEARQRPTPTPATGAQASSAREPGRPYQPKLLELAIPGLLVLLWPIGVVLLWYSTAWNGRDKLIGTFLTLGGYPWAFAFVILIGHPLTDAVPVLGAVVSFLLVLLPAIAAGYLTYQLRWGRRLTTRTA